ncbi:MAG: hypothetical protein KGQ26_09530 [Rhodospirillales bacterium]|nr:hypothetical protein [Rhodospirillales bacterium]MDE2319642.1 hypothetical protein [Rhodospirillales bacterium]
MSRALGSVLLRMFGGHGGSPEQDLRERPEQEEMRLEEKPGQAARRAKPRPSSPARRRYHLAFP